MHLTLYIISMAFRIAKLVPIFQKMVSALTGVMTSVIGKLAVLLGQEYTKLTGVHREVNFMKDELSSINALLQRLAEIGRAHV